MIENSRELPVFPLPQIVLFPDALLPLHIFEPRYQALLNDALQSSKRFVMAVLKPGYEKDYYGCPDVYPQACLGMIQEHSRLPDGRSDVILRGEKAVMIEKFVRAEPYRVARVRLLQHDRDFELAPGASERLAELERLIEQACPGCLQALRTEGAGRTDLAGGQSLLHTIAMHLPIDIELKLDWLACPGTLARWEAIRAVLREAASARAGRARTLQRYSDLAPPDPGRN
jgi:Lon protease-like protein